MAAVVPIEEHADDLAPETTQDQTRGPLRVPNALPKAGRPPSSTCCCGLWVRSRARPKTVFDLMTPTDLNRLIEVKHQMHVPYDPTNVRHVRMLFKLWRAAYPGVRPSAKMKQWQLLGFQQADPASDFRGAGVFALHCMLYFAKAHRELFRDIAVNGRGYPWAAYEIAPQFVRHTPSSAVVRGFAHLFIAYDNAVEKIFAACAKLLEVYWAGLLKSYVARRRPRSSVTAAGRRGSISNTASISAPPQPASSDAAPGPLTPSLQTPTRAAANPLAVPDSPLLTAKADELLAVEQAATAGASDTNPEPSSPKSSPFIGRHGAAAAAAHTLVAGVDFDPDDAVLDADDGLVAQDEIVGADPVSDVFRDAEHAAAGAAMTTTAQQSATAESLQVKDDVRTRLRWHEGADAEAAFIAAGHAISTTPDTVPIEERTAIMDFPQVIKAIRNRLDSTLGWLSSSATMEEFEASLLRGASRMRFKRTPVLV